MRFGIIVFAVNEMDAGPAAAIAVRSANLCIVVEGSEVDALREPPARRTHQEPKRHEVTGRRDPGVFGRTLPCMWALGAVEHFEIISAEF
jgi:hypothetical protein